MPTTPPTEQSLSQLHGTFSLAIAWTCTHGRRITAGHAYDRHCRSTAYAYDDSGRKSKAYDGVSLATAYVYDALGRLLSRTYGTG